MSNINNSMQTQTSNSLHNGIMEAGSKDRPPMLAPGNYIQWKSRIKRYIDTKPNREHIHHCLENSPYELGWKDKYINDAEGNPTTFIIMSNINNNMQTQTSNSFHNAIMEADSKDRPPMLAPGNYIQWKSRIKRYIDTKPNREHIHYCLENPPYELGWKDKFINDAEGNPTTATHQVFETLQNVEQVIIDRLNAEVEAVQIILIGID
nr:hypothetical protein [Tanacetum cinerariifolium]